MITISLILKKSKTNILYFLFKKFDIIVAQK